MKEIVTKDLAAKDQAAKELTAKHNANKEESSTTLDVGSSRDASKNSGADHTEPIV